MNGRIFFVGFLYILLPFTPATSCPTERDDQLAPQGYVKDFADALNDKTEGKLNTPCGEAPDPQKREALWSQSKLIGLATSIVFIVLGIFFAIRFPTPPPKREWVRGGFGGAAGCVVIFTLAAVILGRGGSSSGGFGGFGGGGFGGAGSSGRW